jgi:hypothetical protein
MSAPEARPVIRIAVDPPVFEAMRVAVEEGRFDKARLGRRAPLRIGRNR